MEEVDLEVAVAWREEQQGFAGALLYADDPYWYKDAIIYQLHVKAFQDWVREQTGD